MQNGKRLTGACGRNSTTWPLSPRTQSFADLAAFDHRG